MITSLEFNRTFHTWPQAPWHAKSLTLKWQIHSGLTATAALFHALHGDSRGVKVSSSQGWFVLGSPAWTCQPATPRVSSLTLSWINCCKSARHPATAVFTLEKMDLTETVCKHHKTNFRKLPRFSHLSPSVRGVKVRLKKHRKLLCIPSSCDWAAWLLHGMLCGRFTSPNISSKILRSAFPAAIF